MSRLGRGAACAALCLVLAAAAPAAAKKRRRTKRAVAEKYAAGEDTVKLVEYFLRTPTNALKASLIPTFMSILPATLPRRLRDRYQAKRMELEILKKVAASKKKPPIRRAGQEPITECEKKEGSAELADTLRKMGFEQIDEGEEHWLMDKTRCSECELQEEFSLTIIMEPPKKKKRPWVKYLFLHKNDPIMALLAQYRRGKDNPQGTNFFGAGFFGACR